MASITTPPASIPRPGPELSDSKADSNADELTATVADGSGREAVKSNLAGTVTAGRERSLAAYETAALPLSYTGPVMIRDSERNAPGRHERGRTAPQVMVAHRRDTGLSEQAP